jgi:hypothetical protein
MAPFKDVSHAQVEDEITRTLARLNGQAWGIAIGFVLGLMLLVATLVLVAKGGPVVGPHLALLGIFLPGYSVSVVGAVIGFVYAFVIGYAVGRVVGVVYNAITAEPLARRRA